MLFKFDPNKPGNIQRERTRAVVDKVLTTGTSVDPEERPSYSNHTTYKGFACVIVKIPKRVKYPVVGDTESFSNQILYRYKGIAKEIEPDIIGGNVTQFTTPYAKTIRDAGKELYMYIDMYRKRQNG